MYFAYNSANTQCVTTLTTGVMCTKHLPHGCVWQNLIRKMRMNLDSSFKSINGQMFYQSLIAKDECRVIIIIIIIAKMAVFNVAGYLIEERRR